MDKKNTMLLTVIAVATLLVAVVGATFAFFTASRTAEGSTTVTTTTEKVGTVGIVNPTETMHITLTANDMTKATAGTTGKTFWATAGDAAYVETAEHAPVSRITVSGSEAGTVYTCSYTLTVTKPDIIEPDDMALILTLDGATIDGVDSGEEIEMTEVPASYTVEFTQTGDVTNKDLVKAAVKFNNRAEAQDYLIVDGETQELEVKLTNSAIECTIQ